MSARILTAAVIGSGHLGRHHARILGSMDGVRLIAVCDPDEGRGRAAADAAKSQWLPSVEDLPEDLDLVSIAAPTPLHATIAERFLPLGVNCLIEKPMAATLEEARDLAALAARSKGVVQVGHIERFNPVLDGLRDEPLPLQWIDAQRLTTFTGRSTDTSVVFDLMIHDIDLVLSLARSRVATVEARGGVLRGPLEDWATCRLTFESGLVAGVTASRVAAEGQRRMRLYGAEQAIDVDFGARKRMTVAGPELERTEFQGSQDEPLRLELAHFVECARSGARPRVGAEEGLAAVEVAHQVLVAIRGS